MPPDRPQSIDPDPGLSSNTGGPTVAVTDETDSGLAQADDLAEIAKVALAAEGVQRGHLDLIFVEPDAMAELNMTHMGHVGPTDVLSFPLDADLDPEFGAEGVEGLEVLAGDLPIHLGDIVVCPPVAQAQAPTHCGSVEAELALLVIHGVLHILGHDHVEADETLLMQARERVLLAGHGFTHPEPEPTT